MGERRGTKALELWCRRMTEGYPGVKIDNMTTSWRDGLAFCAMIHHFRPDLIEFDKLNKSDVYYNNELAFTTAEKYLGIPALLDADDMAAYEVPDRLSILTYLSQFYQVFAAQDAVNRLKRPSPATAEKSISKTPGPPPKMAHVVGVPKRDPCRKCQLPVFLAERLTVGKKIYHRTCLKCARCGYQLTPGSFYETEVDDEYCCETCPDEEADSEMVLGASNSSVLMRSPVTAAAAATTTSPSHEDRRSPVGMVPHAAAKTVRSSIADRLAFFEKTRPNGDSEAADTSAFAATAAPAGSHKLSESVTDEEKTQSLQRIGGGGESPAAKQYKMNAALSNFLSDTVGSEPSSMADNDKTEDSLSTDNDEEDESEDVEMRQTGGDKPPELPKSLPPATASPSPNKRFTTTAQLQMFSPPPTATDAVDSGETVDQPQPVSPEGRTKTEIALVLSSFNNNDESIGDTQAEGVIEPREHESEAIPQPEDRQDKDLELSENRNCVTKEKSAATTIDTTLRAASSNSDERHELDDGAAHAEVQLREKPVERMDEDVETTERLSVVRARLQQFEVIANATNNNNQHHPNDPTDSSASPASSPQKKSQDLPQEIAEESVKEQDVVLEEVKEVEVEEDGVKEIKEVSVQKVEESDVKEVEPATVKDVEEVIAIEVDEVSVKEEVSAKVVEDVSAKGIEDAKPQETEDVEKVSEEVKGEVLDSEPLAASPKEEEPQQQQEEAGVTSEADVTESPKDEPMQIEADVSKLPEDEPKVAASTPTKDGQGDEARPLSENASPIPAGTPKVLPRVSLAKEEKEIPLPGSSNTSSTTTLRAYPEDLNPFKSDDDEDDAEVSENKENHVAPVAVVPKKTAESANPFDSSDDEIELEKVAKRSSLGTPTSQTKVPPPRPPPPRLSRNPFGEEEEGPTAMSRGSSLNSSINRRTPVPTPRTNLSQNPTPEPTPRLSAKSPASVGVLQNSSDYYGSANSLSSSTAGTPLHRNSELRGSLNSLASSAGGTVRMRKSRKAPAPPPPVKELFPSPADTVNSSRASTPSSSTVGTPKSARKKRLAPAPPKPARLSDSLAAPQIVVNNTESPPKNLISYPLQSDLDSKLSDEEKALLEGKHAAGQAADPLAVDGRRSSRRLIPLDDSLLAEMQRERGEGGGGGVGGHGDDSQCDDLKEELQHKQDHLRQNCSDFSYAGDSEEAVVYRRVLIPPTINTPTHESNPLIDELNAAHRDRQLEKLKDNKEANNRNRQSQISAASSGTDEGDSVTALYNKSSHGKWKRRKGPAPALPVPPRKVLQMLPLQEIRHELGIIEVQQQGLEKQGVILEKMIRDRCENERGEPLSMPGPGPDGADDAGSSLAQNQQNSKEVEDLILQLFELVNEKNELFRRQAELMYLRRQHRLEQEQADLEYEIRVLMAQPERNKTDSDKAREEALIARLVEVVQLRNEVVECLEMDRLREAEEDLSIKQRLELHTSKRDDSDDGHKVAANAKLSKKEKRKQKESKKLSKNKKIDADKDADETELDTDKQKLKKKKKKFLF